MNNRWLLTAALAAALLGGASVACDDDDGGGGTGAEVDRDYVLRETDGALAVTPVVVEDEDATGSLGPEAEELLALMNRGLTATYTARYESSSPEGDPGDSYVIHNRPPLVRIETIAPDTGETGLILVAQFGGRTASCSRENDAWVCLSIDPLGTTALIDAGPIIFPGADDLAGAEVRELPSETIAGQSARCVELVDPESEASAGQYCLNDAGVILRNSGDFGSVVAVEYAPSVESDDVFLLPE